MPGAKRSHTSKSVLVLIVSNFDYEKIGLLAPVRRAANGHRRYSPEDVVWLEFLMRLRATEMSIEQVHAFAKLVWEQPTNVEERRLLLEAHRDRVQQNLEKLAHNLQVIELKIEHYQHLKATSVQDKSCKERQKKGFMRSNHTHSENPYE
jgi:DNA-binding transcriptional MerR regulator